MKKSMVFAGIMIFVVSFLHVSVFNFIFRKGEASVDIVAINQGFFVGILSTVIFFILFLILSFGFYKTEIDRFGKVLIMIENMNAVGLLIYFMADFISNNEGIPYSYAWMHVVNLVFSVAIVYMANYYGKRLGKDLEE